MFRGPIAEAIRQTAGAPIVHIVVSIHKQRAGLDVSSRRDLLVSMHHRRKDLPDSMPPVGELFSRAVTDTQFPSLTPQRSRYHR